MPRYGGPALGDAATADTRLLVKRRYAALLPLYHLARRPLACALSARKPHPDRRPQWDQSPGNGALLDSET